jgi:hypothetical protein
VTTISEQETVPTRAQEAESAAGGNLEKVRDLLFGGQMRDYDRKFARLEERLAKETTELREDVKKRIAALETYMKAEIASLSDRLRAEQDARGAATKDLGRELRDTAHSSSRRRAAGRGDCPGPRDLREQLHAQHQSSARTSVSVRTTSRPAREKLRSCARTGGSQRWRAVDGDGDAVERRASGLGAPRGVSINVAAVRSTDSASGATESPSKNLQSCARCWSVPNSVSFTPCRRGSTIGGPHAREPCSPTAVELRMPDPHAGGHSPRPSGTPSRIGSAPAPL